MKKSKEEIAKKIQERDQIRAEALLKMPAYRQAIKEYEDIQRQTAKIKQCSKNKELCLKEIRKCNEICDKFSLPYPYPLDELKAIADGKTFFIGGLEEVDITQAQPDQEGFLHFKIKAGAPRYIIHYLLDALLDIYEPQRKKEKFRTGYINPLEVLYKESQEGKNLLQIAKEYYEADYGKLKKGKTTPAYNPELKNIYEQVKRAYKIGQKLT